MCRNIKTLYNFEPPATDKEIKEASLQFVRKITGFQKPSHVNEAEFNRAVEKVALISTTLLESLETHAQPHNREVEKKRAHERALKRFG